MGEIRKNRICWNTALLLMSFVFIVYFLVIISFLTSETILPFVFPASFFISSFLSVFLSKRDDHKAIKTYLPIVYSFILVVFSLLFSTLYYDFSFDGQWYHHPAIYKLEGGWNAFINPLIDAHKSILHFPKGTWYFSASIFSTLGVFETGKCLNIIMMAVASLMAYATLRDYNVSKIKSLALSCLIILHPVVWSEITTFQNDNNLYLSLAIYSFAIFSWLRTKDKVPLLLGVMSSIFLINTKFTGLVFLIVFAFFGFVYFSIYKPKFILKYIAVHAIIIIMGVGVFGFNPYVTNLIHRGHPLYPIMGTAKYPSHISNGKDGNEIHETPKNMMGKPTLTRFFYANFSRPSNAPYNNQRNAELIFPLSSKVSDWDVYRFHDLRIAAFGPFFSGVLVLSFGYLIYLCVVLGNKRWHLLIPLLAIFTSLFLSRHFWWARFGPQLWLFPISLIVASFLTFSGKRKQLFNWTFLIIIIANGLIVLSIHLNWVHQSTNVLRQQLKDIKTQNKTIEICMYWFNKSMNRKLDEWDIKYKEIPRKEMKKKDITEFKKLKTVVEGYPGTNRYRILDNDEDFKQKTK